MEDQHPAVTLEYILLGLLKDNPEHGYALYEKVQKTPELSLIWQVKRSKLYYLLDKLAGEGLLSSSIRAQEGYPDRKIYQLTPEGRHAFNDWLISPVLSGRHVRISFLSKLYFALQQKGDSALKLIGAQQRTCQGWLANLQGEQNGVERDDFISRQVYQFRIGQINATLSWLEECRDEVLIKSKR